MVNAVQFVRGNSDGFLFSRSHNKNFVRPLLQGFKLSFGLLSKYKEPAQAFERRSSLWPELLDARAMGNRIEDGRPAGKVFRKFVDCIERRMYNLMWRRQPRCMS